MACPDVCGTEGGWHRGPREGHLIPIQKKGFNLLGKLQKVQPQLLPSPGVMFGFQIHFLSQDFVAPGWDVDGPAGDKEVIQQ